MKTLLVCGGLSVSYVVFYLGIRVAPWWVALGSLAIIWFAAGFRASSVRNKLTASHKDLGEHWLGIFRDTAYDSLEATVSLIASNAGQSDPKPVVK